MPGIGLMKRRLETEKSAVSLAISGVLKKYQTSENSIDVLETQYDNDSGDWYVALGWNQTKAVIRMDSVLATITEINEINS